MAYTKTLKFENIARNLPQCEGFLIAYSGGADSTALLHLLSKSKNVRAIHINHGLQDDADYWQKHCENICHKLSINLVVERANLNDASENSARKARYSFFKKHLKRNETLLTAHHKQDQTETVLLKLFRGTGISGLTGIDKLQKFSKGYVARPLLDYDPEQLKEYLSLNGVNWIEDESNKDSLYKRNYIRNEIIPSLQSQFPQVINNINRSAHNTRHSLDLLHHLCDFQGQALPITKLLNLPKNLQATMFYQWLSQKNLPVPDTKGIEEITKNFIYANEDKQPHFQNKHYQLYRSYGEIYCIKNYNIIDSSQEYRWETDTPFELPNSCGTLTYSGSKTLKLTIKFNQKGKKVKLNKHAATKSIKNLFQENSTPIWERQITPFIYLNNNLISLGHEWSNTKLVKNKISLHLKNIIF